MRHLSSLTFESIDLEMIEFADIKSFFSTFEVDPALNSVELYLSIFLILSRINTLLTFYNNF